MARNLSLVLAPIGFLLALHPSAATADTVKHHALSLIGEPAYGPDFKHFRWVNPDAPKGGRVRQMKFGTFDSLNPYSIKGSAVVEVRLVYDSLMT